MNLTESEINAILYYLDDEDKITFKEKVIKNNDFESFKKMNIWYQNVTEHTVANYTYYKINEPVYCFYIKYSYLFFTSEKKLIFQSRQIHYNMYQFIKHFAIELYFLSKFFEMKNNASTIDNQLVLPQNYATIYGHFCDEIFVSYDFIEHLEPNYVNLVHIEKNCDVFFELLEILHGKNYINISDYDNGIVIPGLIFIKHLYHMDSWHSFPISSKLKILDSISENDFNFDTIFITRKAITHNKNRLLANLTDIENELEKKGVFIHNPETNSYIDTVKLIQKAKNIVITWGSALTNLAFGNPEQKIVILKSESYLNESIYIFRNLIKTHNLNIKIIEAVNNIIEPKQIMDTFQQF